MPVIYQNFAEAWRARLSRSSTAGPCVYLEPTPLIPFQTDSFRVAAAAMVTEERQTLLREGMREGRNTSAARAEPLRVQ